MAGSTTETELAVPTFAAAGDDEPGGAHPMTDDLVNGTSTQDKPVFAKLERLFGGPIDIWSVALTGLFFLACLSTLSAAQAVFIPITPALILSILLGPMVRCADSGRLCNRDLQTGQEVPRDRMIATPRRSLTMPAETSRAEASREVDHSSNRPVRGARWGSRRSPSLHRPDRGRLSSQFQSIHGRERVSRIVTGHLCLHISPHYSR